MVPQQQLQILNQLFDMEKKLEKMDNVRSLARNMRRIKGLFEELGLTLHNPLGEFYAETRTDCEATISGTSSENLVIKEVIKPIISMNIDGLPHIVQKAVVIVEGS